MYHCLLNLLHNLLQDKSLRRIVPDDPNTPYDMHDIISKIVDDNDFFEIMPHYAMNLIVGFARYSSCLMYWYKSTNTDATAGATQAGGADYRDNKQNQRLAPPVASLFVRLYQYITQTYADVCRLEGRTIGIHQADVC